jgi:uncharacterized protein YecT (DUF1311 family)
MNTLRQFVLIMLLAAAAVGQEVSDKKTALPVDPCPESKTEADRTACWDQLAAKAQADLNILYVKIQGLIRARIAKEQGPLKTYQETALTKLRAAQLAWTRYRDAQCDASEQQYEGGTIAPSVRSGCIKDLSEHRMEDLQKTYAIYLHQ